MGGTDVTTLKCWYTPMEGKSHHDLRCCTISQWILLVMLIMLPYSVSACDRDNCAQCSTNGYSCNMCIGGYYLSYGNCYQCRTANCATCSSAYTCKGCNSGYYLYYGHCYQCQNSNCLTFSRDLCCRRCNEGYYLYNGYCYQCLESECATCSSFLTCTGCNDGYYLYNGRCNQCRISNCARCSSASTCTGCNDKYYLYNGRCTNQCRISNCTICSSYATCTGCNDGFYLNKGYCLQCEGSNCAKCSNSSTCTGCNDGFYLQYGNCHQCHDLKCATCSNFSTCTGCNAGYYLYNEGCHQCQDSNCVTCSNFSTCTVCNDGYYLYDGSCFQCQDSNCVTCSNSSTCTGCSNGYYLYDGNCNPCQTCATCSSALTCTGCNNGYYLYYGKCHQCRSNCATCISASTCTGCNNGYYLFYGYCFPCQASNCATCSRTSTCTGCNDGFYLYNGYCFQCQASNCTKCNSTLTSTGCNDGFYLQYGNCYQCQDTNCATCSSSSTCTVCNDGYYLHYGNCNLCHASNCAKCSVSTCTVCNDGYYLYNGYCNQCQTFNCATCSSALTCTVCNDGYYLYNRSCYQCNSSICRTSTTANTSTTSSSDSTCATFDIQTDDPQDDSSVHKAEDNSSTVISAAIGGGSAVGLGIIVILVVCFIKRRPTESNQDQMENSMQEISNVGSDIEHVTTAETDVDAVQLEINDGDGITADIDMGDSIPSSDTYYNMEGFLRSQVKITQLFNYVKQKTDYDEEFKKLLKGQRNKDEVLKLNNRHRNRHGIHAYDANRVVLHGGTFINASYIDGHNKVNEYIALLGPTASTMNGYETFWEMVWQNNVGKIVMLTKLDEGVKMKCEQYWPNRGDVMTCGQYILEGVSEKIFADFVIRQIALRNADTSHQRHVTQYQYTAWPDRSVPDSVVSLVAYRDRVEQQNKNRTSSIVVHCSAGIGRTGTYIALDNLLQRARDDTYIDIFGCAFGLLGQRVNMIQTEQQYEYLHYCVLYVITCNTGPIEEVNLKGGVHDEEISTQYNALKALESIKRRWLLASTNRNRNQTGTTHLDDHYRVHLESSEDNGVNAVYINSYRRKNQFIISQTPLSSNLQDFITMIYQEKCPVIVCLDDDSAQDKNVGKYIPPDYKLIKIGPYQVTCTRSNVMDEYTVRDLELSHSVFGQQLNIRHYQIRGWNSKDIVPSDSILFLKFVQEINDKNSKIQEDCPILIHCQTGADRSGLLCGVSTMLETLTVEKQLSIVNIVHHISERCHTAFKKYETFKFCYDCVKDFLNRVGGNKKCTTV